MPTATPEPTAKPTGEKGTASPVPTATPVSSANRYNGLGSSLIYVQDDSSPTPEPTAAPTPETIIKTEYITIGPGMPYQADGNSHTLDVLYSAATNKQFITLQTKNGNTFYLVIDYDKPVDEEAEMYETYFLNLVDERDLLALMSDEEKEEVPTPTPEIVYVTPEPTAVPAITPQPSQDTQDSSGKTTAWIALAALVGMGLAGGVLLIRSKKQPAVRRTDNDFDLDEDDEDEHAQQE